MNQDEFNAVNLKQLLIELSPLIEELTADVCPECTDVCCKQKRCILDPVDVRYLNALRMPPPDFNTSRPPEGPCQFMGQSGCVTPRWFRPWRCTWYFCDPLLSAMNRGPQKTARKIADLIQQVVDIRSQWQSRINA
jgi:hypothetical protein